MSQYINIRKSELAAMYGYEGRKYEKFRKLLNDTYYDELLKVGYDKNCVELKPIVVRKLFELHGKPLQSSEFEDTL